MVGQSRPGRATQELASQTLMRILGIETSCDETAAAVVEDGLRVRSSVISTQHELHRRFGGVVPEIACRAHIEHVLPAVATALEQAGVERADLDAIAVTTTPGLIGALLIGVTAAKALSWALDVPLLAANHLHEHIYAAWLAGRAPSLPAVSLVVSGGHTSLFLTEGPLDHRLLGGTVDDAAGEAFDKIARFIGLGFPGGPALDRLARDGDPTAIRFPRAMLDSGDYDFSLSGLKTSVLRFVRTEQGAGRTVDPADLAASFQEAIVDVQVTKTIQAAKEKGVGTVLLGGGVVANTRLRERMARAGAEAGISVSFPSLPLCTDNAAMIACAGEARLLRGERTSFEVGADPGLELAS